jgi:kynureninase
MAYLTREAHKKNIVIGFDCCHSVGAIPHYLSEWDVDFAFWCNYKYMNSGPGGAASMYVNRKHFNEAPALTGWFGYVKEKQFDLKQEFISTQNAGGWQVGTPHILSMAPLEGSLRILHEAGIDRIREKSLKMTAYLMNLIDHELKEYGFRIGNPREDNRRGGHVALEHDEAVRINEAIKDRGIVPDFRYPNIIRLAPVALYTSYHEIWRVVQVIKETVESRTYERYSKERGIVA